MAKTCGDFGGINAAGKPCGTNVADSLCSRHRPQPPEGLTKKQAMFVEEYLVDLNGLQAAIRAGFSENSAGQIAHQLLQKPHVALAVQEALDARTRRLRVTQDRVVVELARIAFADLRQLVTWGEESTTFRPSNELDEETAATVASVKSKTTRYVREDGDAEERVELEIKAHDKVSALRELRAHLGVPDKHEVTGKDGEPLGGASPLETLLKHLDGLGQRRAATEAIAGGA